MKLCLFALTGFGNPVLEEVLNLPEIRDVVVYTRKEKGVFPHYECEQLADLCKRKGICAGTIPVSSAEAYEKVRNFKPDMLLLATFNQKISDRIIRLAAMGAVNIHPSLLPKYRGPTPTNWAVINGEGESGVTFHTLEADFDMGDILFQRKVPINGLTDGELRKRLAGLAGEMIRPFFDLYTAGKIEPLAQNKSEGHYYPNIASEEGLELLRRGAFDPKNIIRGVTPCPGTKILS